MSWWSVLNSILLSSPLTLNCCWLMFFNFFAYLTLLSSVFTDTTWTNTPGTDKKWRIEEAREDWSSLTERKYLSQTYTRHHVHHDKAGENHLCSPPQQRPAGHPCRGGCLIRLLTITKRSWQIVVFITRMFWLHHIVSAHSIQIVFVFLPVSAKVHRAGCF